MKRTSISNEELCTILKKHELWLKGEEGGERADLSYRDLSGRDLSGLNLEKANLSGADLSWANLSGTELTGADFTGAKVSAVELSGARMSVVDSSLIYPAETEAPGKSQQKKETELKPCPFCGGEKLKLDRKSKFAGYNGLDMRVEQHTYSVRCNVCHARGGAVGGKVLFGSSIFGKDISPSWATTDAELKQKAIEAWNRRADNEQR